jgi:hypothetical protein
MKRTPLKRKGKKDAQWNRIRATVKPWFDSAGFTYCELGYPGCNIYYGDGFAHAKVRTFQNENDLHVVAYLCNICHNKIETKDEAMEAIILSIRVRNHIPELDVYLENYTPLKESRGY